MWLRRCAYQRFGRILCLHHQGARLIYPEDGGSRSLRSVGIYIPNTSQTTATFTAIVVWSPNVTVAPFSIVQQRPLPHRTPIIGLHKHNGHVGGFERIFGFVYGMLWQILADVVRVCVCVCVCVQSSQTQDQPLTPWREETLRVGPLVQDKQLGQSAHNVQRTDFQRYVLRDSTVTVGQRTCEATARTLRNRNVKLLVAAAVG